MVLAMVRMVLLDATNAILNPWRKLVTQHLQAFPGLTLGIVEPSADVGLAGTGGSVDDNREDPFGPFWFAVPKKRVRQHCFSCAPHSKAQYCPQTDRIVP